MEGEKVMRVFDNYELDQYAEEVREKWGKTDAYKEYAERTGNYFKAKQNELAEGLEDIMTEFAQCMRREETPDSAKAQSIVKTLQNYITENYYQCTNDILAGLGQMYVADERFKNNIDKHAEGTAAFISEAIAAYCGK